MQFSFPLLRRKPLPPGQLKPPLFKFDRPACRIPIAQHSYFLEFKLGTNIREYCMIENSSKIMNWGNVLLGGAKRRLVTVGPTRTNGLWLVWTTWFPQQTWTKEQWNLVFISTGRPEMEKLIFNLGSSKWNRGQSLRCHVLSRPADRRTRIRIQGSGFRVQGSGFRVQNLRRGRPSDESQAWLWHYCSDSDNLKCPRLEGARSRNSPNNSTHSLCVTAPLKKVLCFTLDRWWGRMRIFHHHWQSLGQEAGSKEQILTALNSEPEGVLQCRKSKKIARPRISEYKE